MKKKFKREWAEMGIIERLTIISVGIALLSLITSILSGHRGYYAIIITWALTSALPTLSLAALAIKKIIAIEEVRERK